MNDLSLLSHEQTYVARHYDSIRSPLASNESCPNSLRVRATRIEDLPSLAELLTESFYPPGSWMSWLSPLFQMGILQDLRSRLYSTTSNHLYLVAIQNALGSSTDSNVAGTVEVALRMLSPWQLSAFKQPYISNLAVKPDYRRQGIAEHLLLTCEQAVLEWGFQDLYLHVLENNQPARQLYAKVGYQEQCFDYVWPHQFLFGQPRRLLLHKHLNSLMPSRNS